MAEVSSFTARVPHCAPRADEGPARACPAPLPGPGAAEGLREQQTHPRQNLTVSTHSRVLGYAALNLDANNNN